MSEPSDIYGVVDLSPLCRWFPHQAPQQEFPESRLNKLNLNLVVDWIRQYSLVHGKPAICKDE